MIFENTLEMIGNTPIIKIDDNVFAKFEKNNPGGSVKDRAALGMIEEAEKTKVLKKGDIIVEPTSGNTGIALALIGSLKGYEVIIVMPETFSAERRKFISAYGAKLVLTDGTKGMKGAIEKAEEMAREDERVFVPMQFINAANPQRHYETTAEEIIKDVPDLEIFVTSVGSGGTIIGVGRKLKEYNKNIKVIAVEPEKSPVLSGGVPGAHKIQGIGAGFIPEVYDSSVVDEVITVSDEKAFEAARNIARNKGILVGISSGANIYSALELSKRFGKDKKIVTIIPDGGEKYLSSGLFE